MQVVSGTISREKNHFEAPGAERLEDEMATFLVWFGKQGDIDPVIKAGIAHLLLVTIRPFEDGNGRIARAISDMALACADGIPDRFYNLSSQIESGRKDYYRNNGLIENELFFTKRLSGTSQGGSEKNPGILPVYRI
jgi:Fic family protein